MTFISQYNYGNENTRYMNKPVQSYPNISHTQAVLVTVGGKGVNKKRKMKDQIFLVIITFASEKTLKCAVKLLFLSPTRDIDGDIKDTVPFFTFFTESLRR